jgi:hypothetical protein
LITGRNVGYKIVPSVQPRDRNMRHLWKPAALAIACAAALLMQAAPASADETATVEQDANLRAEPDTDSEVLDELAAGSTVEVVCWTTGEATFGDDTYGSMWLMTSDPGYVHSFLVEPVDVPPCDGAAIEPQPVPVPVPVPNPADVLYENCQEAIEADVAPLRVDDPGYGTHLDDDLDGIGCEWVPEDE